MLDRGRRVLPLLLIVGAGSAVAQPPGGLSAAAGGKTVHIVRAATPPVIDGKLDDAVWAGAAVLDDFHQVNPLEYAPASERTEIRLLYDDDALYVAAKLYQPQDEITAHVLRQNASITGDDTLFVTIDPFNSRRAGYFFGVNPNGVRYDGLYRNVSEYYTDWDSIFYAETSRFDGGWIIEYAIPFKSISFDPSTDTWGLNFSRTIQTRHEDMAWASRNRRWDPSTAGQMTGLTDLDQGVGLDIVPSASAINSRVLRGTAPDTSNTDFEPSLDVFYKITPSLNASLTFNTDFSATEVDDRQVNLTRFGLFFPEKRDFFLRESDIFEFGRIGASDGNGALSNAERNNARPFFSRRIGLGALGEPIDLNYGGKVSGRIGRFDIGALSIRQDDSVTADAGTLSVVRAKAGIGDESTIGTVLTSGDPLSNTDNSLVGFDYLYRNSRLPGGRVMEAGAWFERSDTPGLDGDDAAFGVGVSVPSNAKFRGGLALREVQANFNPALGFLSRRDVRDYMGHLAYTDRPVNGFWQSIYFGVDGLRIEALGGGLQSQQIGFTPAQLTNRTGDVLYIRANFAKEVLYEPFEISRGVLIPGDPSGTDYSFADWGIEGRFAGYRTVSGNVAYTDGDFYGGTRARLFGNVVWAPSPRYRTSLGFNINDIELPQGRFTTRILTTGFDVVFSSRLSWTNLIQYDNVSELMGVNLRLNWIPEAGKEFFFVINHNLEDFDRDNSFHSATADVVAKISYTFRF
jgi:hypothetical protein